MDGQAREDLFKKFLACWDAGFRCFYCKRIMELKFENEQTSFSIDHTIPKAKNGRDIMQNLEFVCRTCNLLKGNRDAENYINNMERLIARENKREYFKARKASMKDKRLRESFKDMFEMVNAKKNP